MTNPLRSRIIRLAHANPQLRPHLIPLVAASSGAEGDAAAGSDNPASSAAEGAPPLVPDVDTHDIEYFGDDPFDVPVEAERVMGTKRSLSHGENWPLKRSH